MRDDEVAQALLVGAIEEHMVADVPICGPDDTAAGVRTTLIGRRFASVIDVAVCEADAAGVPVLRGLISIEALLAAKDDQRARDLMDGDPVVVAPGLDQEQAAWKAARRSQPTVAVVDSDGRFQGMVPPARLLSVMLTEHDEDLARLGGFMRSTAASRHALEEPLEVRLWHRLPWLVIGLIGSALAAIMVRGFEGELERDVRLAFFIPGIVYMADAVGTQTEALVIRGMSVGVDIRRVFALESLTGFAVGVALAAVTVPVTWWVTDSLRLGITLGVSLMAACAVATIVAMMLPWLVRRLGRDPAFGSGPLATVVQDLLSLLIYFAAAMLIMS
ncbi:MAG: magnesium transporter [Actinomycetota bacterium]|nr:magnesium transporter [Actinomycetota bacterium]